MPKHKVRERARARGITVHFGNVMELVFEKHSELRQELRKYKGRVVFRGDTVTDETGFYAVFTEQGTSASHLSAAKFLDAIARMPGNDGGDSDAIGAYHQVKLDEMPEHDKCETWVSLPRSQRPPHWDNIEDPVCLLKNNLYGHPLAGLWWEKFSHKAITAEGFERVKGWECLYVHRQQQLFLSVYVDYYKMAGKASNLQPMWARLRKHLELEDSVPLHNTVYLGCQQYNVDLDPQVVQDKRELVDLLIGDHGRLKPDPNKEEPESQDSEVQPPMRGVKKANKRFKNKSITRENLQKI